MKTTNKNTVTITEKATKLYDALNNVIEELHPKKVKAPKKPAVINQAKKLLEREDFKIAIKKLSKEGRSISKIVEVLNLKLRNSFKLRTKTKPVDLFLKNNRKIPVGNIIQREVIDSKTKKKRLVDFVEIKSKDKFTTTMIQDLLGVKKKTRKTRKSKVVVAPKAVVAPKVVEPKKSEIDNILDSLVAWTPEEKERGIKRKIDTTNWDKIAKPKKKRTIKNKTCKECRKFLPIEKIEDGYGVCKKCFKEKFTPSEEELNVMSDLYKSLEAGGMWMSDFINKV